MLRSIESTTLLDSKFASRCCLELSDFFEFELAFAEFFDEVVVVATVAVSCAAAVEPPPLTFADEQVDLSFDDTGV